MTIRQDEVPLVIFGVPFHRVTLAETVRRCLEVVEQGTPGFVATPNLDFVMRAGKDPELYRILARADLVIADGMPIVWLAKVLGPPLPERVAGSDLVSELAGAAAAAGRSIFHLGGAPGVPEKAAEVLKTRFPELKIAGCYSPPRADLLEMDHAAILNRLRETKPDILYVAFGAPKQEKWMNLHYRDWQVGLALGIGGSLDFLAGAQRRAPKWMQKSGTEWIWRLGSDPKRLWKRYGANLVFLTRAFVRAAGIRCRSGRSATAWNAPREWEARRREWRPLRSEAEAASTLNEWLAAAGEGPLWIDLRDCAWLDSRELGVWMVAGRQLRERDLLLVVTGASSRIKHWLAFNGLNQFVTFAESAGELPPLVPVKTALPTVIAGGELVLTPPAELTAATLPEWRIAVREAWDAADPLFRVRVDAAGMSFLDSAGLGALIGLRKRAVEEGLEFRVKGLKGPALTTVRIARAERLLSP